MKQNNHGHIVALSSAAGLIGFRNLVPYCASKSAVRCMMEALYEELRFETNSRIKFTTICPYMVDTGLCKRPRIRFARLMPMLTPKYVAEFIVDAQRRDVVETTIPGYIYGLIVLGRLMFKWKFEIFANLIVIVPERYRLREQWLWRIFLIQVWIQNKNKTVFFLQMLLLQFFPSTAPGKDACPT